MVCKIVRLRTPDPLPKAEHEHHNELVSVFCPYKVPVRVSKIFSHIKDSLRVPSALTGTRCVDDHQDTTERNGGDINTAVLMQEHTYTLERRAVARSLEGEFDIAAEEHVAKKQRFYHHDASENSDWVWNDNFWSDVVVLAIDVGGIRTQHAEPLDSVRMEHEPNGCSQPILNKHQGTDCINLPVVIYTQDARTQQCNEGLIHRGNAHTIRARGCSSVYTWQASSVLQRIPSMRVRAHASREYFSCACCSNEYQRPRTRETCPSTTSQDRFILRDKKSYVDLACMELANLHIF
jgi:hypothetical protein